MVDILTLSVLVSYSIKPQCVPSFEMEILRDKMNCAAGFVYFFRVPLACLGSMAQGGRAGTPVELLQRFRVGYGLSAQK